MIAFQVGGLAFGNRVAGIAIQDGHVLLHRAERDDFWSLPGGRGELLEPSAESLRREMREEMGIEVEVERLVWVVENFFQDKGIAHHELGLYYLMRLPRPYDLEASFYGQEENLRLVFRWFPLEGLEEVRLYPTFLRRGLQALPETTQHIVHTDEE
jgi:ADP-ribose pyrophosphatase YjhB (NUDIX family)